MKRTLIAIAVSLFAITAAAAADMSAPNPTYVKAPVAAPVYNWTGCFVGVNGGYGWNNGNSNYNDPNLTGDPINGLPNVNVGPLQYIPTATGTSGSGGLAGGGAGCNWQSQQWVFGIEGDFDWANISGSRTTSTLTSGAQFSPQFGLGPNMGSFPANTGAANEQVALQWFSTVRARVGIAVQDRVLLYATGGLAMGKVNSQGSVTTSSSLTDVTNPAWIGSNSTVKTGFVVGGGAEWAFHDHWSVKAEYLWYDLGSTSHPLNVNCPTCTAAVLALVYPTLGNVSSPVVGSIVRVGLNYKFN
jgi:outer membrane immunogenic protein